MGHAAARARARPDMLGVQAPADVVAGVEALLRGARIHVGRYAPPSEEELHNFELEATLRGVAPPGPWAR